MTLSELIAALEKATEGSRELDHLITETLYLPQITKWNGVRVEEWWRHDDGESYGCNTTDGWRHERVIRIANYTTSLDAALLNERFGFWEITGPRMYLHIPTESPNYWCAKFTFGKFPNFQSVTAWGATEALARRIAALKAMQKEPAE